MKTIQKRSELAKIARLLSNENDPIIKGLLWKKFKSYEF